MKTKLSQRFLTKLVGASAGTLRVLVGVERLERLHGRQNVRGGRGGLHGQRFEESGGDRWSARAEQEHQRPRRYRQDAERDQLLLGGRIMVPSLGRFTVGIGPTFSPRA